MRFGIPNFWGRKQSGRQEKQDSMFEETEEFAPRKHSMQEFFRNTSESLKAKIPGRQSVQQERDRDASPCYTGPRDSAHMKSLDINEEALERILGQPKDSKRASSSFWLQQRMRADSAQPFDSRLTPTRSLPKAERDRLPICAEELREMLSGALYFSVKRSQDIYEPCILLGHGSGGKTQDKSDCTDFSHPSFAASTLRSLKSNKSTELTSSKYVEDWHAACEVPTMLGAQGNDPGTIGYEHYLQLPVADSTVVAEETNIGGRKRLLTEPGSLGLQALDMVYLVQRLTTLGHLLASIMGNVSSDQLSQDNLLGKELFSKLISDEAGERNARESECRLAAETEALEYALGQAGLWHDFSLVEWRIRAGQLLWVTQDDHQQLQSESREPGEMEVLILQATLAAELLVRTEILKQRGNTEVDQIREPSVAWSMVLARVVLENLTFSLPRTETESGTYRQSFLSAMSYFTASANEEEPWFAIPLTHSKKETAQLEGLLHFAEEIGWPHAQDVRLQLEQKQENRPADTPATFDGGRSLTSTAFSMYATPLSSPMISLPTKGTPTTPGSRHSYFGGVGAQRPGFSRKTTAHSMQLEPANHNQDNQDEPQQAGFEVGGWLSRSWLMGLVMPGEAASHFLISTLLENSPQAIEALGDQANLYGGFLYAGRQFWSKSCVVGRVLAATDGAKECMGWISVNDLAKGQADGWINLDVKDIPEPPAPKIKLSGAVARDSDPLHGHAIAELQMGDFTTPVDGPPVMGNEVRCEGMSLIEAFHTSLEDAYDLSMAELTFSSPLNKKLAPVKVSITYDVNFVSSYPCYPSASTSEPRARNKTPPCIDNDSNSLLQPSYSRAEKYPSPAPAHPLHVDYNFTIVPVTALLSAPPAEGRVNALSAPGEATSVGEQDGEVTVLDCRGTGPGARDLELLARAWCAKVGESAVVGKEGRTCLSCCVREARAVGVSVVIRI
ncbi:hypothetical protein MBLNU230_g7486t1 [Neophaeotheca triangularis]